MEAYYACPNEKEKERGLLRIHPWRGEGQGHDQGESDGPKEAAECRGAWMDADREAPNGVTRFPVPAVAVGVAAGLGLTSVCVLLLLWWTAATILREGITI